MDTDTTTTDLVIIDAELVEDDDSMGNEIAKTLATTAATSAVIIGGIYAYKFLKPKIASLFSRAKNDAESVEVVETAEDPETAQV